MWKLGCGGAIGLFVVLAIIFSIAVVPAGNVGVITRNQAIDHVVNPGLNFKIPFIDALVLMNTQTQKLEVDAAAASKDLQTVTSKVAVNYHLDGAYATNVFQDVGSDYIDKLLAPAIPNTFKAATAQFTAEQLITTRETVRILAEQQLKERMAPYHIIIESLNITNFDFSPEYNAAIEQKQVAQQSVETAKQLLAKAQVDAQTVLAAAQGQADAQKALKDSGALSPEYLQYKAIDKWNGILPLVTGGAMPFIDLSQLSTPSAITPTSK